MFCRKKSTIRSLLCGVVILGLFTKVMAKQETVDLEDFLNKLDEVQEETYENADAFVKPMDLVVDADAELVMKEAKQGNLVLVNIADLSKRNKAKLRELVMKMKDEIKAIDGDIAQISAEKLLITPSKVKIIKKKGQ